MLVGGGTLGSKLYFISSDSLTKEVETYGHGEFGEPDWEVESIPIFLDFCLECFEGGTVNVDCDIIWSGVGREDINEALVDELRLDWSGVGKLTFNQLISPATAGEISLTLALRRAAIFFHLFISFAMISERGLTPQLLSPE
jgi:hypothetical protein